MHEGVECNHRWAGGDERKLSLWNGGVGLKIVLDWRKD